MTLADFERHILLKNDKESELGIAKCIPPKGIQKFPKFYAAALDAMQDFRIDQSDFDSFAAETIQAYVAARYEQIFIKLAEIDVLNLYRISFELLHARLQTHDLYSAETLEEALDLAIKDKFSEFARVKKSKNSRIIEVGFEHSDRTFYLRYSVNFVFGYADDDQANL